jgi:hypothetical protein
MVINASLFAKTFAQKTIVPQPFFDQSNIGKISGKIVCFGEL